jgi:hypothetical protein
MSADPPPNPPQNERRYEQVRKIGAHKRRLCAVIEDRSEWWCKFGNYLA